MKRIFTLILLAGAMLAGLNAEDKRWILAASSQDGKTDLYVDSQTLGRDGETLLVWEKFAHRSGEYYLDRMQIQRNRRFRILSITAYNADGDVTGSSSTPTEWTDVAPGSLQETLNDYFDGLMRAAAAKQ